ncbi:MAG: ABC transporter permease [Victivallaceae bacterium]|nr:ABC transporter permease [Victivallaceae bacterium]MDD4181089.1 ABC transporter permease [Victivallaceae bacterium]
MIERAMPFWLTAWRKFRRDPLALAGLSGALLLIFFAIYAPLISNSRPLMVVDENGWSMPFLSVLFAPDSTETTVECGFNYLMLWLPIALLLRIIMKKTKLRRALWIVLIIFSLALLIPFLTSKPRLDKTDYLAQREDPTKTMIFTINPYGPFEQKGKPHERPSITHWMGTDNIGRDITARMFYGARVSLAVGLTATTLALLIGTAIGLCSGYFGGKFDLITMRLVEIVICFPSFLLLLILMSMFRDYKFEQSILVIIAVIGLTDWIGVCRLVRGEVLKARMLPYISSCEVAGMPVWRLMVFHLLPNISGPILISFTFGIVGAIVAESGLSFLGFGVQAPTASWGGLLRQAFDDPFYCWPLTLFPGLALFFAVCSFNFVGEGLRKIFDPKTENRSST